MPVLCLNFQAALAVIPHAMCRVFKRKCIIKCPAVTVVFARDKRTFLKPHQMAHMVIGKFFPVIGMSDKGFFIHKGNNVACVFSVEFKDFLILKILDSHK